MISPLSAHVTLRGIKARVTRELSARCAPRFRLSTCGDSWLVTGATGRQSVCSSLEEAALVVVSAVPSAGRVPAVLGRVVLTSTLDSGVDIPFPDPASLSPAELVDCLLWFAATRPRELHWEHDGHPDSESAFI
ncbi:hypothetical protein GCM10022198_21960 [Klugiella xanthotipulae]|uniref:Uncharacterized protein n=1 Tax=Klugiella xanthotipulae TaxID=244735 RepID=A0A543HYD1_9MICO|nr:hypothetical protein [Klugiella xanthotipulae]TQM63280.1 hypothetical protein FB466_1538 [Klugiella xanthotipulae]